MIPEFDPAGNLPAGIHEATWHEIATRYGGTAHRRRLLDPILLDFSDRRRAQKASFGGEMFPAEVPADQAGTRFLDYFQQDKTTGARKGIVALDLKDLP